MSATRQAAPLGPSVAIGRLWRPSRPRGLWGGFGGGFGIAETSWAIAFLLPYLAVFLAFVVYPIGFGLYLGRKPELYEALWENPRFPTTVANTLLLVGIGVNVKMFAAFLLSGFFLRPGRWIKALLVLYMLPWALPALSAFLSLHWMFIGRGGFMNSALEALFDIDGPIWFNSYWLAMGTNIVAYIWKWMPFWTLVFIAGRMAIPRDIYEAAAVDGATGLRRFTFVTFPLLANLYLVCTLLSTLWTAGDFAAPYFVSSGAPALQTEVLATFGFRMAFDYGHVDLGVAAMMSALPVLIPLTILLIRRVQATEVQL